MSNAWNWVDSWVEKLQSDFCSVSALKCLHCYKSRDNETVKEIHISSLSNIYRFSQKTVAVCTKKCVGDAVFTTYLLGFDSPGDVRGFLVSSIYFVSKLHRILPIY